MDSQVTIPLTALEAKLNALISTITSTPTASGAPAATHALLEADDALTSALGTLRTHQANYAKILKLRAKANGLEDRVREIVQQVADLGDEISSTCEDEDSSDEDGDGDEGDKDKDVDMEGVINQDQPGFSVKKKNEVDYKLLLDFARRLSKFNNEAAADAAAGTHTKAKKASQTIVVGDNKEAKESGAGGTAAGTDTAMGGVEGNKDEEQPTGVGVGVAALPQDTVSWLDETANWTRAISAMPYPNEDRIRMGLMGQLQASVGGDPSDLEKEVERMMLVAEGKIPADSTIGVSQGEAEVQGQDGTYPGDVREPGQQPGPGGISQEAKSGGTGGAETTKKPKPKLDLDLYDPDDDDFL